MISNWRSKQGKNIDIYAWADSGRHRIGEFHLNYVRAIVDRKANQASHTPRIFGKASLANWFGRYKHLDAVATVRVVSPNEIELM